MSMLNYRHVVTHGHFHTRHVTLTFVVSPAKLTRYVWCLSLTHESLQHHLHLVRWLQVNDDLHVSGDVHSVCGCMYTLSDICTCTIISSISHVTLKFVVAKSTNMFVYWYSHVLQRAHIHIRTYVHTYICLIIRV